ncbi:MAG: hypothetical protein JST32_09525 [Bacteroidetes bacterium]|nr:hypothetical protein [Bacteroidota bacterium]
MSTPANIEQLKTALENISCLDHRAKPRVKISDNMMTIVCCCHEFHQDCIHVAEELSEVLTITGLTIR